MKITEIEVHEITLEYEGFSRLSTQSLLRSDPTYRVCCPYRHRLRGIG